MPEVKRYPSELRERAVRMVFEVRERSGQQKGAVAQVADQLGVGQETLRNWVLQAEIDSGGRLGTTTTDAQKIAELEREVRELRGANEILKAASTYFARELDPGIRASRVDRFAQGLFGVGRPARSWNFRSRPIT